MAQISLSNKTQAKQHTEKKEKNETTLMFWKCTQNQWLPNVMLQVSYYCSKSLQNTFFTLRMRNTVRCDLSHHWKCLQAKIPGEVTDPAHGMMLFKSEPWLLEKWLQLGLGQKMDIMDRKCWWLKTKELSETNRVMLKRCPGQMIGQRCDNVNIKMNDYNYMVMSQI